MRPPRVCILRRGHPPEIPPLPSGLFATSTVARTHILLHPFPLPAYLSKVRPGFWVYDYGRQDRAPLRMLLTPSSFTLSLLSRAPEDSAPTAWPSSLKGLRAGLPSTPLRVAHSVLLTGSPYPPLREAHPASLWLPRDQLRSSCRSLQKYGISSRLTGALFASLLLLAGGAFASVA